MKSLELEDFAPLSGVLAVVFLATAVILFGAYDYFPSPDRTVEIFTSAANRSFAITLFGMYAGLALCWFSGSLFSLLRQHESGAGRLAPITLMGGVVAGAGMTGAFGVIYFAAGQSLRAGGLDPTAAWVSYSVYSAFMELLHGFVLMVGAAGLAALRTKAFPAWFGWVSVVIALGMVTPADYIFEGAALVWIVGVSLWIFVRETREAPGVMAGA